MADGSYWSGNICGNRGNHVSSILVGRGMHTLGILLGMVALGVVTICRCNKTRL